MKHAHRLAGMVGFGMLAMAVPAVAQTTYSNSASFSAAAGTVSTVDFQGCSAGITLATNASVSSSGSCTGVPAGVTLSPPSGGSLYIASVAQSGNPTIALGLNTPGGGAIDIGFSSFETNFGADLFQNFGGGSQSGSPASFTIAFYNGASLINSYAVSVASGTGSFFGVTGSSAFNDVKISQAAGYAVIDNVQFGTGSVATATPEPATWAMMLLGFGAVGVAMRRVVRRSEEKFDDKIKRITDGEAIG